MTDFINPDALKTSPSDQVASLFSNFKERFSDHRFYPLISGIFYGEIDTDSLNKMRLIPGFRINETEIYTSYILRDEQLNIEIELEIPKRKIHNLPLQKSLTISKLSEDNSEILRKVSFGFFTSNSEHVRVEDTACRLILESQVDGKNYRWEMHIRKPLNVHSSYIETITKYKGEELNYESRTVIEGASEPAGSPHVLVLDKNGKRVDSADITYDIDGNTLFRLDPSGRTSLKTDHGLNIEGSKIQFLNDKGEVVDGIEFDSTFEPHKLVQIADRTLGEILSSITPHRMN